MNSDRITQAIVLAAGEGQRLRPFTASKPKVMIKVGNQPVLQYVVEAVARNGIHDVVLVVGYRREEIQSFFGSGERFGMRIQYVVQQAQAGTAHALKQAAGLAQERFLLLPGDNVIDAEAVADLLGRRAPTVLTKRQENTSKDAVVVADQGRVLDLVEKPQTRVSALVNTGVYVLTRQVFDFIGEETDLPNVIREMVRQGHEVGVWETDKTWLDIAYPWDILTVNEAVVNKDGSRLAGVVERGVHLKGPIFIGDGTLVRANSCLLGPLMIGKDCEIGPNVCLLPFTTIGDNSCILPFTMVKNSVIGDHVDLGPGTFIQDSVIDRGCRVGAHFVARSGQTEVKINAEYHEVRMGAMLGEYCLVEDNVVAQPGTVLGNRSCVKALKVVAGNIPDGSLVL